ncbi:hypothetical protein ABC795_14725 [Blastococcus sp. HT6-30]|uniref:hypothetical protein n=1 Tax=Blastococcus sp. HT6-30 TaxID=3144843 RepID=UPI00321AD35C
MGRRWRLASVALAAALVVGLPSPVVPAQAAPGAWTSSSSRPTADSAAPTPTAPRTGLPPRGSAPDGSTVGGERLRTRGVVVPPRRSPATRRHHRLRLAGRRRRNRGGAGCAGPARALLPGEHPQDPDPARAAPRLDPALVVEGSVEDEEVEGSRVGLVAGGRYPVPLLFTALMLQSGNDAASALARAAGGRAATLALMNRTAAELGAFDTVAGSPSGLDVAGQSTSPPTSCAPRRPTCRPSTAASPASRSRTRTRC